MANSANNLATINISNCDQSSIDVIKKRRSQELIIGLCGAVGSGISQQAEQLKLQLTASGYHVEHIKLSTLMVEYHQTGEPVKHSCAEQRYQWFQDLGDTLRKNHSHSVIADMGVRRISILRKKLFDKHAGNAQVFKTTEKVAYIIDQLKHPKEIDLFRQVYCNNFYLLGILRTFEQRKASLIQEGLTQSQASTLIEKDQKSKNWYGQQVEASLYLADYFLNHTHGQNGNSPNGNSLSRFINLIHGVNHITPSKDEVGMYAAFSASLSSACLSRQVGAAIADEQGNIIATGFNDVPKSSGGLYTANDQNDQRCFNRGVCSNDKHKQLLKDEIKQILTDNEVQNPSAIADQILLETKAKSLIEYSRSIHAEMAAITTLARNTSYGTQDKILYSTTYPCHNCARHIVAAGIKKVVYIEPYEKSLALQLHDDAICHPSDEQTDHKVMFINFEGVAPTRYSKFFGYHQERKDDFGRPIKYPIEQAHHVDTQYLDSYLEYELKVVDMLNKSIGEEPPKTD